jgi:NAD dependent epimerase/dehydratase family enzyme
MIHLLGADVRGPVNLTSPEPVTNAEFTRTLGRVVHRPTVLPLPGPLLNLGLRDFGRTNVVGGQRAVPTKLLASGYRFRHTDLEEALRAALQRG